MAAASDEKKEESDDDSYEPVLQGISKEIHAKLAKTELPLSSLPLLNREELHAFCKEEAGLKTIEYLAVLHACQRVKGSQVSLEQAALQIEAFGKVQEGYPWDIFDKAVSDARTERTRRADPGNPYFLRWDKDGKWMGAVFDEALGKADFVFSDTFVLDDNYKWDLFHLDTNPPTYQWQAHGASNVARGERTGEEAAPFLQFIKMTTKADLRVKALGTSPTRTHFTQTQIGDICKAPATNPVLSGGVFFDLKRTPKIDAPINWVTYNPGTGKLDTSTSGTASARLLRVTMNTILGEQFLGQAHLHEVYAAHGYMASANTGNGGLPQSVAWASSTGAYGATVTVMPTMVPQTPRASDGTYSSPVTNYLAITSRATHKGHLVDPGASANTKWMAQDSFASNGAWKLITSGSNFEMCSVSANRDWYWEGKKVTLERSSFTTSS